MKKYYKPPTVLEASHGTVTKIKRYDNSILFVGQETLSGGQILTLKWDTDFAGNMCAEIGKLGVFTAVPAIVLP
jgi:hypothetical protein